MKCDELKAETIVPQGCTITLQMYPKAEVDAAIAELKQKLEDVQASAYAESVDAGMRERRLRRALWMHRAITAKFNKEACKAMREYNPLIGIEEYKWQEVERKCRAKAEEYK